MSTDTGFKFGFVNNITIDGNLIEDVIYGVNTPTNTIMMSPQLVYGTNAAFSTINITPLVVYGVNTSVTGQYFTGQLSNINGEGDIIYYGEEVSITCDELTFACDFRNNTSISGLVLKEVQYNEVNSLQSNSIVYPTNGQIVELYGIDDIGTYIYFGNNHGGVFSISGVNTIVTSYSSGVLASVSGFGSHLGLISNGGAWIAIEEGGVL